MGASDAEIKAVKRFVLVLLLQNRLGLVFEFGFCDSNSCLVLIASLHSDPVAECIGLESYQNSDLEFRWVSEARCEVLNLRSPYKPDFCAHNYRESFY